MLTPLHIATKRRHEAVVRVLLRAGKCPLMLFSCCCWESKLGSYTCCFNSINEVSQPGSLMVVHAKHSCLLVHNCSLLKNLSMFKSSLGTTDLSISIILLRIERYIYLKLMHYA